MITACRTSADDGPRGASSTLVKDRFPGQASSFMRHSSVAMKTGAPAGEHRRTAQNTIDRGTNSF
jgi:hypothetical protein